MRVVSLVPSWTETLLDCGVNVVGRTRYCMHPEELVKSIPVVGGTKDLDFVRLEAVSPDILIVDKEENLPWMAETNGRSWKMHCSHVEGAGCMPGELEKLGQLLCNEPLISMAAEWRAELARPCSSGRTVKELPGILEWLQKPVREPEQILYLIWRNPWMAVSADTFVGSILAHLGYGDRLVTFPVKYPKLDLESYDPTRTLLLFSSEPFPFVKKREELLKLGFPCALVNGESFSWFGSRSLRFLSGDCSV